MFYLARHYAPRYDQDQVDGGKREASLIAGLAEAEKTIFSMADARAIIGSGAKDVVRRLVRKKWVLPLKRGLYAVVPLDVGVQGGGCVCRA